MNYTKKARELIEKENLQDTFMVLRDYDSDCGTTKEKLFVKKYYKILDDFIIHGCYSFEEFEALVNAEIMRRAAR